MGVQIGINSVLSAAFSVEIAQSTTETSRGVRLHGAPGGGCSSHSVPTILFNELAQSVTVGLFQGINALPSIRRHFS
jgi:galactokinase